jgi:hypothetical protein
MSTEEASINQTLRFLRKNQTVWSWTGPSTALVVFLGILSLILITLTWYLNEDTTSGWIRAWSILTLIIAVVEVVFLFNLLSSAGSYARKIALKQ